MQQKIRERSRIVMLITISVILQACAKESDMWTETSANPTENGYVQYIESFPDGEHIAEAQQALEELIFQRATSAKSVELFEQYLAEYPNAQFRTTASFQIESLSEHSDELNDAAANGNLDVVMSLVAKTDINLKKRGHTPLMYAAYSGHKEVVQFVISEGADVNARADDEFGRFTALIFAAHSGRTDIIRLLLAGGANVNARSTTAPKSR